MKHTPFFILILFFPFLFTTCLSSSLDSGFNRLSARTLNLVRNAVFEVVIEKPEEDSVVYDRELNWDNVPFAIRNDKYHSIGTAFAISKTELITAFHVVNLGFESLVHKKYFIRDSEGSIYEINQITGGCNERDFLIFNVNGRTFDSFFTFERNYKIGDPVFSIGNALGEGIVVRNGLVLGTVPEGDSGRWDMLKSSADGNPGNSGGPLVTPNGRVVALVTALRDNILYSVPADTILSENRSALHYRNKMRFGHLLLVNELDYTIETTVSLPNTYTGVREKIRTFYRENYDVAMNKLFDEAPIYLKGSNNAHILYSSLSSSFPEISFVDRNDDNWKLSNLNARSTNLGNDGQLRHINISGYHFYKIKKPANVSLIESVNVKNVMDLILQNLRTERNLWGNDKYRILSYGEPFFTGSFDDALGRTWISAYWLVGYNDSVQIMFILPMPDGPVVISTAQSSTFLEDYQWDLRKICDHLFAAYLASFNNWIDFLSLEGIAPDYLQDFRFRWNNDARSFSLNYKNIRINTDANVFDWTGSSELFLAPSWYKINDNLVFGIRKFIFNKDSRGKDFFNISLNIKPDQKLGSSIMNNWNDLAQKKFPFDGSSTISARDNNGSVGVILDTGSFKTDSLYSLYFSMENPVNEENLNLRFNALRQGIFITE